MNKAISRLVIICLVLLLLGGALAYALNYFNSFSTVSIHTSNNKPVNIYAASGDTYAYNKAGNPVATLSGNQTAKLKKARYVVVMDDSTGDYLRTTTNIYPRTKDFSVSLDPAYTSQKLTSLLPTELLSITNAVRSQVNNFGVSGYEVKTVKLYDHGQWAGVVLTAPGKDTYRVILEKKDGSWKVATNPPQIVLSAPLFPSIPSSVVSDINTVQ